MSATAVEVEVARIKMLLAEAGYPDADVQATHDGHAEVNLTEGAPGAVPERACWQAFHVLDPIGTPCWPCWDDGTGPEECARQGHER